MTQNTMRVVGAFWALDYDLSRRRHFPAINWTRSYSLYDLRSWFASKIAAGWPNLVAEATALLQQEVELLEIVQLVGPDALAEQERAVLASTRMLREDFLQQSAYHAVDRYCSIEKTYAMLKLVIDFHHLTQAALQAGIHLEQIETLPVHTEIARMKELEPEESRTALTALNDQIRQSFAQMGVEL
jgi:V/A-type H+/Na+-transporting ATPase subunit A